MTIKIIVTGGTFDKEYDELKGRLFFKETHVHEMIKAGRCALEIEIETLLLKDSKDLTNRDKKNIVEKCRKASQDKIIITHGTDTMVNTAKILAQNVKGKTIVLTGAMIPTRFNSSDGQFNLGSSLAFVQLLPYGVYVSMNGKYYNWNNVYKNRRLGRFEELKNHHIEKNGKNYFFEFDDTNVDNFIKSVKKFVKLNPGELYSIDNIYSISGHFNLKGVIYLEKNDSHRHVNILLYVDKDSIIIYDPVYGIKRMPFNEVQFGMYCKPIGIFKDEFERYEQRFKESPPTDVWGKFRQKGKRLFDFLSHNNEFMSMYSKGILNHVRLPVLQEIMNPLDCVPLSLFVISISNSLYLNYDNYRLTVERDNGMSAKPTHRKKKHDDGKFPNHRMRMLRKGRSINRSKQD